MAQIALISRKCTGCGACAAACPFGAIARKGSSPRITDACRLCGLCVKACPQGALYKLEAAREERDLSAYSGAMTFAEVGHPVSLEMLGKACELNCGPVRAVVVGSGVEGYARELLHYGADEVLLYDDPAFDGFRADAFAAALENAALLRKPSVMLVGATAMGRSLAPRVATRLRTGLTADCTSLAMRPDGSLVQIRPAFGGNIMAQIVTPGTRPQFATVRYKVMNAGPRADAPKGVITRLQAPEAALASPARHLSTRPLPGAASISDAEIIIAAGRGVRREADLAMLRDLAARMGGEFAVSRPLAERGWESSLRQIGLSGRTVKPRLIIACGISGAVQFAAGMMGAETIVAINTDPEAPIFKFAHVAVVADLYEAVPALLQAAGEGKPCIAG